jgi:hypothetical protein
MKKVLVVFEYGEKYATAYIGDDIEERWKAVEDMRDLWMDDMACFLRDEEGIWFHGYVSTMELKVYDYSAHVHMNSDSSLVRLPGGPLIKHKGYVEEED